MLLDIHTHHPAPQPEAVVALRLRCGDPLPRLEAAQRYSIGIHPWDTVEEPSAETWEALDRIAAKPEVVAIGESGVDLSPRGGFMFRQVQVFKRQAEISERLRKPLVIHDVKGSDIITGMRRDLKPVQNWAIHGFRRKPEAAAMLLRAGCWISFGPIFNAETLRKTPPDRILAETDDSEYGIREVVGRISDALGRDMTEEIAANTAAFLGL